MIGARLHLGADDGFSLVELLVAVTFLAAGVMALVGTFDLSRNLITLSERKEAAVHVGEREMERIHSLPYSQVALTTAPLNNADPKHPASYVTDGTPSSYRYDQPDGASENLVVDATNGALVTETPWSDGRLAGTVHSFVTTVDDAAVTGADNYRRVTLAITVAGVGGPAKATLVTSLIRDPGAAEENPLVNPQTTCTNATGQTVTCYRGIGHASSTAWFLHDTPASASARQPITGGHPSHDTVGPTAVPDLLSAAAPEAATPTPPLHDYSEELVRPAAERLGRGLLRGPRCDEAPSASRSLSAFWVTTPLADSASLSGEGGLTLYSAASGGSPVESTICAAFYRVGGDLATLGTAPPTQIGRASYGPAQWPEALERVSFAFDFAASDVAVAAGERVGLLLWAADAPAGGLALAYDHPDSRSSLQLNATPGTSPGRGGPPCAGCSY